MPSFAREERQGSPDRLACEARRENRSLTNAAKRLAPRTTSGGRGLQPSDDWRGSGGAKLPRLAEGGGLQEPSDRPLQPSRLKSGAKRLPEQAEQACDCPRPQLVKEPSQLAGRVGDQARPIHTASRSPWKGSWTPPCTRNGLQRSPGPWAACSPRTRAQAGPHNGKGDAGFYARVADPWAHQATWAGVEP